MTLTCGTLIGEVGWVQQMNEIDERESSPVYVSEGMIAK
jgi:hypothetical protein